MDQSDDLSDIDEESPSVLTSATYPADDDPIDQLAVTIEAGAAETAKIRPPATVVIPAAQKPQLKLKLKEVTPKMGPLHIESGEHEHEPFDPVPEIEETEQLGTPLIINASSSEQEIRSRRRTISNENDRMSPLHPSSSSNLNLSPNPFYTKRKEKMKECCHRALEIQRNLWRNTIVMMNFMAKVLFWCSLIAMSAGIVYYTRELAING